MIVFEKSGNGSLPLEHKDEIQVNIRQSINLLIICVLNNNNNNNNNNTEYIMDHVQLKI